jgi:hypothetical protein
MDIKEDKRKDGKYWHKNKKKYAIRNPLISKNKADELKKKLGLDKKNVK